MKCPKTCGTVSGQGPDPDWQERERQVLPAGGRVSQNPFRKELWEGTGEQIEQRIPNIQLSKRGDSWRASAHSRGILHVGFGSTKQQALGALKLLSKPGRREEIPHRYPITTKLIQETK